MSTSSTLETLALLIVRSMVRRPELEAEASELWSTELDDEFELFLEQLAEAVFGELLLLDFFNFSTGFAELLSDLFRVLSIELFELSLDRLRFKLSTELSLDRLRKLSTEVSFERLRLMLSTELSELPLDRHRRLMLSKELFVLSMDRPRRLRTGISVEPSVAIVDANEDDLESVAAEKQERRPYYGNRACISN